MESPNWTAYNAAQSEEKRRFVELLADLGSTVPQPKQEGRGRPRLPLSDMLFTSVYKVYVGFSSRRHNRVRSSDRPSRTSVPLCKTPSIARSRQSTVES